ncbi:hypothetical protein [Streptomyces cyaneofuscatus]|uniref:hypothetical protein n=1 Tax=Streptomyces cyaneofuscatus TaxID=66883 RepID=UPI0037D55D27
MKRKISRLASSAAVATILATSAVVMTPTSALAAAATKCSAVQKKTFDTIGANLTVAIKLCVQRTSTNYYSAWSYISWNGNGDGLAVGMEKLKVNLRLERNDADYRTGSNDYTSEVNAYESKTNWGFGTTTYYSSTSGGWTADGNVEWDINNDGKGGGTWSLGGSPSI